MADKQHLSDTCTMQQQSDEQHLRKVCPHTLPSHGCMLGAQVAFVAVMFSTVAVVAAVVSLPLVYTAHAPHLFIRVQMRSRDMYKQMDAIAVVTVPHRQRRSWLFGQWVNGPVERSAGAAAGGYPSKSTVGYGAPPPVDSGYGKPVTNSEPSITGSCCTCQQGPVGPPGDAGVDGDNGTDGTPGQDGAPGNNGTLVKAEVKEPCTICPPGPPGPVGVMGAAGPKGPNGAPGEAAHDGKKGEPGMVGPAGPPGRSGQAGPKGPVGEAGKVIEAPGPAGPPGPKGTPGLPGTKGEAGKSGNGKDGPKGDAGDNGDQGPPGKAGPGGAKGPKGPAGEAGSCAACPPPRLPPGY